MTDSESRIDWSLTTWEGSRKEQLRRWQKLSVRERLQAVEDMSELAKKMYAAAELQRTKRGHCRPAVNCDR